MTYINPYRFPGWIGMVLVLVVMMGISHEGRAQDRLEEDPGYVDFTEVADWFEQEPTLEVNIKGALLRLVAEASRFEDPELAEMLFKLRAIQVRGFPLSWSNYRDVRREASTLADRLVADGWDTVVRVREEEERVDMYLKMVEGSIAGLVVMAVEPGEDESVFINIVGEIDPEQVGRLGRKFDFGESQSW